MEFISKTTPTPISLSGVTHGEPALPVGSRVTLQLFCPSDPTRLLFFRVTGASTDADTALNNAAGFVAHGGTIGFDTEPGQVMYLHWALFTAAGVAATAGASDYIYITREG